MAFCLILIELHRPGEINPKNLGNYQKNAIVPLTQFHPKAVLHRVLGKARTLTVWAYILRPVPSRRVHISFLEQTIHCRTTVARTDPLHGGARCPGKYQFRVIVGKYDVIFPQQFFRLSDLLHAPAITSLYLTMASLIRRTIVIR